MTPSPAAPDPSGPTSGAPANPPSPPPDLVPLRALNQVTYCPRLYFLQYVDAVMPVNEHVEAGRFDHRRVTHPELSSRTRKEGDTLHTRSVSLSSEVLGLTGVLDLLEEKEGEAYPVETKHGSAPRDDAGRPTFWSNDAVQLCGQAMLLEEHLGRPVPRGFLYYAGSRERVEVALDEPLRRLTREALAQIRELSARREPPPPLSSDLRHRCHGCSLNTICLPEETLYELSRPPHSSRPGEQGSSAPLAGASGLCGSATSPPREQGGLPTSPPREQGGSSLPVPDLSTPAATLTRVIPESDDGAVLYLQEPGSHVGVRSEHLVVRKDNRDIARIPLHAVRQVVVFGHVQISTQALDTLASNDIPVSFLTGFGRFIATFAPAPAKNVSLREAQFRRFADPAECLTLAKAVVRAKLVNQRTLLMRCLRARGDPDAEEPVHARHEPAARDLVELVARLAFATDLNTVLGLEGQGASLYFGEFGRFLKAQPPGRGFDFRTRNRRPPRDPVNALLSFSYAMLVKDCFAAVCTVGFDPYKGFFHQGRHGRPSLALDLMEEFRAVIADSVVLTLINNRTVTPEDFLVWHDACQLTEEGRKKFFAAYEQRKATVVTHPVYGYKMSYSRMLEVQARMLAAYVRGGIPEYTGFIVR